MGLFNNKDRNSVQLNELTDIHYRNCYLGWGWYEKHKKKFHSLVLWSILDQIFRGLMNVSFINQKKPAFEVDAVISFLESNYVILLDQYWALGFMAVQGDRNMNFRVIPEQDIKKDTKGRVINKNSIVVYSPHYQTDRITDLQIIRPERGYGEYGYAPDHLRRVYSGQCRIQARSVGVDVQRLWLD